MENIPLPTKVEVKKSKENKNKASIIIEPCYPGYGITLGNALRRVLLSSLKGGALVAVKIKGVHHEFSTIPYVKEDVVDIILNLKQLRLRIKGDNLEMLHLDVKGEKKVKASDIKTPPNVEIANPDLEIATLTDKKAHLEMKLWAKSGRGYLPSEEQEKREWEVDTITMDSIFTPIVNVGFKVENTRVGERTDFEKLILDIETDGTITPEEALKKSALILVRHFNFVVSGEEEKKEVSELEEGEKKVEREDEEKGEKGKEKKQKEAKKTKKVKKESKTKPKGKSEKKSGGKKKK